MKQYRIVRPTGTDRGEFLRFLTEPGRVFIDQAEEVFAVIGLHRDLVDPMMPVVQIVSLSSMMDKNEIEDDDYQFITLSDFRSWMGAVVLDRGDGRIPFQIAGAEKVAREKGFTPLPRTARILNKIVPPTYVGIPLGRAFAFYDEQERVDENRFFPICLVETMGGPAIAGVAGIEKDNGELRGLKFTHISLESLKDLDISEVDSASISQEMVQFWANKSGFAVVREYLQSVPKNGGLMDYPCEMFDNTWDIMAHFSPAAELDLSVDTAFVLGRLFGKDKDLLLLLQLAGQNARIRPDHEMARETGEMAAAEPSLSAAQA